MGLNSSSIDTTSDFKQVGSCLSTLEKNVVEGLNEFQDFREKTVEYLVGKQSVSQDNVCLLGKGLSEIRERLSEECTKVSNLNSQLQDKCAELDALRLHADSLQERCTEKEMLLKQKKDECFEQEEKIASLEALLDELSSKYDIKAVESEAISGELSSQKEQSDKMQADMLLREEWFKEAIQTKEDEIKGSELYQTNVLHSVEKKEEELQFFSETLDLT